MREALAEPVNAIVEATKLALERTPPELSADIVGQGIVLVAVARSSAIWTFCSGRRRASLLMLAEEPLTAVAIGTGRTLDEMSLLREVAIRS